MGRALLGMLVLGLTVLAVSGCARPLAGDVQPVTAMSVPPLLADSSATRAPNRTYTTYTGNEIAVVIYQMTGTVESISQGVLHLSGVEYRLPAGAPLPSSDLSLPPGRWVSREHRQSRGDTLDLFLGDPSRMTRVPTISAPAAPGSSRSRVPSPR